jgi:valyl-tRNA synthetase
VLLPLQRKAIPIITDTLVDPEFGTGCVKVTPAHDPADYDIARRHNLPFTVVIGSDGAMTAAAGARFAGLDRFKARTAVVKALEEERLLLKTEAYVHNVGYSQRSQAPVEPCLSQQWFLRYPSVEPSIRAVEQGKLTFYPDRWVKTYLHWMRNLRDWCISRQLWWGHRIPVWYRKQAGSTAGQDVRRQAEISAACPDVHVDVEPPSDPENWEQDPDVLDTWFSSWLWPFATMGWPEQTDTLRKFYPTTDLVTGPDIIFFWVARMIMAGYEFMGAKPFARVYYTGIIRDRQGRKLSKSLGNSPDPLELIDRYGADALRFGIMRSAPLGQDLLYDEQHVELGRNFCNKLWNACRFRQMQGAPTSASINPAVLTSDDRWILLRLDAAVREINEAFAEYRFHGVTQVLYRLFWGEFCDWYLEASKAALQGPDPAWKANTLAVIDFVLSRMLRLFHPFLPFITEELWHDLGCNTSFAAGQGGDTIMFAPWPLPLEEPFKASCGLNSDLEQFVAAKYDLVVQGRNLRREGNVPSNRRVRFVFKPAQPWAEPEIRVLKVLLNAEPLTVDAGYQPPKGTPTVRSPLGELALPLEGLIDVEAEKARLDKELAKCQAEIDKVRQKLANPDFVQKVPPAVLDQHKRRLAEWAVKREQVHTALNRLAQ